MLKRERETVNYLKSEMSSKLLKYDLQKEQLENTLNHNKQEAEAKISELCQKLDTTTVKVESMSKEMTKTMMEREKELVGLRLEHHKQMTEMKEKVKEENAKAQLLKIEIEELKTNMATLEATKQKLQFDLESLQSESEKTIRSFTGMSLKEKGTSFDKKIFFLTSFRND